MKLFLSGLLLFLAVSHADTKHVYFGTGGREAKGIYQARFDSEKGALSAPTLAADVKSPGFLAMHPSGNVLYAVAQMPDGAGVIAYTVSDAGALTLLNTAPIGDGGGAHIAVHSSGKFLLTAQYGGGSTACFRLDADGKLAGPPTLHEHEGGSKVVGKRQDSPHPHWCGFSPDGRFAFVPDLGMDGIVIYKVDAENGAIEKHGFAASISGGGPRHMRFSVDGKFIYLLNELALAVTTFAYDAEKGTATQLTTTQALSDAVKAKESFNSASEILVHPNGKFVYSANRGNDSVTAYLANPETGKLTVTEVEPIRGAWPRNINLDSTGKWLLAAGANSNTISVFEIDQDSGELTFRRGNIVNVPGSICILFGR